MLSVILPVTLLVFGIMSTVRSEQLPAVIDLSLFQKQMDSSKKLFEQANSLYAEGIISRVEFEQLQSKYKTAERNYKIALITENNKKKVPVKSQSTSEKVKMLKDEYKSMLELYKQGLVSENELVNIEIQIQVAQMDLLLANQEKYLSLNLAAPGMNNPLNVVLPDCSKTLTSLYGYRIHPFTGINTLHTGIDIAVPLGTPVKAYSDGVVQVASTGNFAGNFVQIAHGKGYSSLYLHLSGFVVKPGQKLKQGQLIGFAGSTGRSTGNHLHFELRKNNISLNINNMVSSKYKIAQKKK